MYKYIILYLLSTIQPAIPKSFHAYAVASNGKNIMVDPEDAKYVPCNQDIRITGSQIIVGGTNYDIYRHQQSSDSMVTFFCHRQYSNKKSDCSVTIVPMKETKNWYVLAAWGDSTRAYKTIISR